MELIHFSFNEDYQKLGKVVVALGEFDGIHIAHQILLKKTIEYAKEENAKSAVISFDPHPDFVLNKRSNQGYITPLNVKAKNLEELGIDYFIVINFTLEFSKISPEDFENNVLKKFLIKRVIIGFDYRYGYKGQGNCNSLRKHFSVFVLERINFLDSKMGSNEIRELLLEGKITDVTKMLGRPYNITGKVVKGNQIGRQLGIRTANVTLEEDYQVLKKGVYGVIVTLDNKKYLGVCNIGNNPTINYVEKPRLEVHILEFNESIYDETISIDFIVFLREEKKFNNSLELVNQINQDILDTKRLVVLE